MRLWPAVFLISLPRLVLAQGAALNSPDCIKAPEARAERPTDEVLGVGRNGEFCAYPVRMMAYHRIVNDHLGGPPILVYYDPTSALGAVYDPVVDSKELTFDIAGDSFGVPMVKDRQTGSLWNAVTGEAVQGQNLGRKLKRITCWMTTWSAWQKAHADSWVLKEEGSQSMHYVQRATQATCAVPMLHPGSKNDSRLPVDALVLGISTDKATDAATVESIVKAGAINIQIGGKPSLLIGDSSGAAAVYEVPETARGDLQDKAHKTKPLRFMRTKGGAIRDDQTHSEWSIEGRAISGPMKGTSLVPMDFVRARWYAWSAAHPGTSVIH
jgi:hypothetical protein